jgi:hypothetical protein
VGPIAFMGGVAVMLAGTIGLVVGYGLAGLVLWQAVFG